MCFWCTARGGDQTAAPCTVLCTGCVWDIQQGLVTRLQKLQQLPGCTFPLHATTVLVSPDCVCTLFPDSHTLGPPGPPCIPHVQVRLHCPPRLPRKLVHAIRHASAKLFTQMGCRDIARVSGWAVLQPGWNDRYRRTDVDVLPLFDIDPVQMDKMAAMQAQVGGVRRGSLSYCENALV